MNEQDYKLIEQEVRYQKQLSEEDKEDLVQDVCVKLLETKPKTVNRAFIRTLIRNMLIDRSRRRERRPDIVCGGDVENVVECPIEELVGAMRGDHDVRPRAKRTKKQRRD